LGRCLIAAPARLLLAAGAALFLQTGCDRMRDAVDDGPRVLELSHDTIQLAAGVRLVDVKVVRTAQGDFEPAAIDAKVGDVVRFTADDHGGHALVFDAAHAGPQREFLERTGQMRSPPLISRGAAWVITLDGAVPGVYRFRCTTHDVPGQITVAAHTPAP